jgi:Cu(I)/Ag(I) efflux system membrane fusion protein
MSRIFSAFFVFAFLSAAALIAGCGTSATPSADKNAAHDANDHHSDKNQTHHGDAAHQHAGGEHGDDAAHAANIAAAMAELSPEDRALAEKQKVCLVADGALGSMGAPIKVEVKGHTVFICCEGCREDLLADPDKYLAKLKK